MTRALFIFYFSISPKFFSQVAEIKPFQRTGLDCSWDPAGSNYILYSKKGADKFYDICMCLPDGSLDTCVTCNHPQLPNKHIANMAWHPSGKWMLAVVEKGKHNGS